MGVKLFDDPAISIPAGATITFDRRLDWFQLYESDVSVVSELQFSINNDPFSTLYAGLRLDLPPNEVKRLRIKNTSASEANIIVFTGAAQVTSSPLVVSAITGTLQTQDVDRIPNTKRFNSGESDPCSSSSTNKLVWGEVATPGYVISRFITHIDFWQDSAGVNVTAMIVGGTDNIAYAATRLGINDEASISFPHGIYVPAGAGDLELYVNTGSGAAVRCVMSGYWTKVAT